MTTEEILKERVQKELQALKTSLNLVGLSEMSQTDPEFNSWCERLEKDIKVYKTI